MRSGKEVALARPGFFEATRGGWPGRAVGGGFARAELTRVAGYLRLALAVARERRALARLSPHLMRDVGYEPWQVRREACRSLWDLPARRL
jgi:uncharacterized protein YjiS (DUF1127 family)